MITKGTTHNNGVRLAAYMTKDKEGEHAELWQLRGFGATNIKDAFRDVQIMAGATKCEQPFFHVQVRNREGETLTRQQWEYAADRIERMLGLTGQPRAITFHTYDHNNDEHMHLAWSRIDEDTLTAKPLPFFKERLKKISRELELHFALEPVTNEREGSIKYAPTRAQEEQARRVGVDIHQVRNTIRECWDCSDNGRSFQAAIEDEGLMLAQGDRRGFVVIDQGGGIHALSKRILDVTAAKIRDRLSDLDANHLPSVEQARALILDGGVEKQHKAGKAAPVWDRDRADNAWQNAVIDAAIEKEKIERQFAEPRDHQTSAGSREKEWLVSPVRPEPITTKTILRFEDAAKDATKTSSRAPTNDNLKSPGMVGKSVLRTVGKTLEVVGNTVESLFAPTLTPEQIRDGEKATHRREAEGNSAIDYARFTAEVAERQQLQESQLEAERRLRQQLDGGGRER